MTKTFRDLAVHPALCDALEAKGITNPFPIQELTLPLALEGHDLIGQARTGTGKTLAFGLPLLQRLDPSTKATQALVIVPTRELCLQVYEDLKIGAELGLTSISVYGGVGYDEQIDALTTGVHIVVGTPGRLLDHLNRGNLDLSNVTQLVLDEADEMLDMGFLPDVERLVESCQGDDRHTMLFSATMPTPIVKLARRYMDHPTFTRADDSHEHDTVPTVEQHFFQVHRMDKPRLLARILQDQDRGGVYVFVRTKHMADRLVNELEDLQTPSIAIHGDLRQSTREKNLDRFREGKATVLVATEVAARGLDVHGVTHVVNYDCPDDEKMYLHRIGRTARAGESGKAITFAEFNEVDRLNVIRKKVGALDTEVVQAFSTSPLLGERFRLPEIRPWDHLTTEAQEREANRSGSRRGGNARKGGSSPQKAAPSSGDRERTRTSKSEAAPAAATAPAAASEPADASGPADERAAERPAREGRGGGRRREGRSDGRPKSGRASEGRGGDRDASRDRRSRASTRGGTDDAARRDERPEKRRDERQGPDADSGGSATRTRTRTRARTQQARSRQDRSDRDGSEQDHSDRARTQDEGARPEPQDADGRNATQERSASSGRTRARTRGRSGEDRSSAGQQRGGGRGSRSADDTNRDERAGRDRSGGGDRTRDGERSGGGGKRRSRGGQGRGGGSGQSRGSGGGQSRGGERRDRDQRSSGREQPSVERTPAVAARGEEARGEGQPQRARRVRVEHLP